MQARLFAAALLPSLFLAACGGGSNSPRAVDTPVATNNDGSPVTGVITARFDPSNGVVPNPTNLLLSGTTDLTINIPVADPTDFSNPRVAINALDGFSTASPMSTGFSVPIKPSSVVAGSSVRVFQVTLTGPGGGVTGITNELQPNVEYVTALPSSDTSGRTVAIVPTKPLKQLTSYMVVMTNGITDNRGNDATPDQTYFLAKRTSPLCVGGASTDPLLPSATACALEPLRQLTNSQEFAASQAGIDPSKIVLSWVMTTQSITPVLGAVQARTAQTPAAATQIAPTGLNLSQLNPALPPIADVYIGTIDLPYYLNAPTQTAPTAPLGGFWRAAPGAYVPPFNQFGLDPTSTFVTFANPLPVANTTQKVPLVLTVPNAASGKTKPAAGWPIVIFQHGITRNRSDAFAIAGTLASQGFAVIAIDAPLHGITDPASPLNVANTPFAALGARERTFNLDLSNNTTGAPGPDGVVDSSGSYFINLPSLLTSRDNIRQAVADLLVLARAVPSAHYSNSATDFDGSRIGFVGQSLGGIIGTVFMGVQPNVQVALLNVPGGGIPRLLEASPAFGPRIIAGLGASGLSPGTPDYDAFFGAAQTVTDSADPINWALPANNSLLASKRLLLQEVVGGGDVLPDQVIPNAVAGAPLSGTEPLIRTLGLSAITQSTQSAAGIRGVVRFTQGNHGSLLDPTQYPAATAEMQGEMASLLVSQGTAVQVSNPSVIRTQ
ncbi:Ig-like domain-containing protein [Dokdonella immobilis]|uniref:Platelet-activating factor acetylhydrolase, isoform II n=1 Tax=Dokdonella immobilis TaxID=578942 RepID=A0A1I4ZYK9_9GAMM|nr:Ig-like domain-containing protein [Dokdonella immobilis]SFN55256.1 Platelet-activating factor acetylhydrolase, isoform II [Dokdonella immobilis]